MKRKVRIKVGGGEVVGTLFFPGRNKKHKTVVFFNGSGGTKERYYSIAESLLKKEYVSFCFDFRGRGESLTKGVPPFKFQLVDAKKVLEYLIKLVFVDENNLTLVATSMGGYVAASVFSRNKGVRKMILLEPTYLLPETEERPYSDISIKDVEIALKDNERKISPIKEIGNFTGKLYLVIHEKSGPYEAMKKILDIYYNNATKAKTREILEIKDVPHAIFREPKDIEKARRFLETLL